MRPQRARKAASSTDRLLPLPRGDASAGPAARHRLPLSVIAHLLVSVDLLLLIAAGLLSILATKHLGDDGVVGRHLLAVTLAALAASAVLRHRRAYHITRLFLPKVQARFVASSLATGFVVLLCSLALQEGIDGRLLTWSVCWLTFAGLVVLAGKLPIWHLLAHWRNRGVLTRRVAIVGATEAGREIAARYDSKDLGAEIVGFYDDSALQNGQGLGDLPLLGGTDQLIEEAQRGSVDAVILTGRTPAIKDAYARLCNLATETYVLPDAQSTIGLRLTTICGIPVCAVEQGPLSDWQVMKKALLDRSVAAMLLLVLSPILLLISVLIKLDSRGPVLFRQTRIGFNNVPFLCYKFRTMYSHMADPLADVQTVRGDRRVTRVGRWLRRLSLDELPQVLNVLLGDMSLVGPRPHAPNTKAGGRLFTEAVEGYARRHRIKPGITGWAQVNGWRGETATVEQIEQRVKYDLYYTANWSLLFDLRILLLTLVRGMSGPQAY